MPELTPRLGLKKPLGNENVTLASFNENYDILDAGVATKSDLDSHNNAAAAHGATPEATANRIVQRNAAGQFKVGAPTEANHVARKADLDEVKQSVSDGKTLVAGAITDKGVPTSPSDTFQRMAENIGAIETDKTGDATATAADILAPKTAYAKGKKLTGTMPNRGVQTITPGAYDKTIPDGYIAPGSKVVGDPDLVAGNIRSGKDIFGVVGNVIESTGDAAAGDVLAGKTFSKAGQAGIVGMMPNNGAVGGTITQQGGQYTIPAGYHNGFGTIAAQFANLVPENVRQGVNIGGVEGTSVSAFPYPTLYEGESVNPIPFVEGINVGGMCNFYPSGIGLSISSANGAGKKVGLTTQRPINLLNVNKILFNTRYMKGDRSNDLEFYIGISRDKYPEYSHHFFRRDWKKITNENEETRMFSVSVSDLSEEFYICVSLYSETQYAVSGRVDVIGIYCIQKNQ